MYVTYSQPNTICEKYAIADIKSNLDSGNYEIHKSPGDGHCLIYSVLRGMNSNGTILVTQDIIIAIKNEIIIHSAKYMPFMVNPSLETLLSDMNAYLYKRKYDFSFGDLVPYILANALSINIAIVSKITDYHDVCIIRCDNEVSFDRYKYITVYKTGKHYDTMALKPDSGSDSCNVNKHDVILCDSRRCQLCMGDISECTCRSEAQVSMKRDQGNTGDNLKETRRNIPRTSCSNPISSFSITHGCINILFWNIHGLSQDKLSDNILGNVLKKYDIILLSETWASDQDEFALDGFEYHNYPRKHIHPNGKRNSGGLGVFIRQTIREGVDKWCHSDDIVAWYILRKSFFGIKNDIYLANIYIVPENSTHLRHDEFDILKHYMEKIPHDTGVLLCGDYNARTGELPDLETHFSGSNGDLDNLLPPDEMETHSVMEYMRNVDILTRCFMDKNSVNKHGSQLIEFCRETGTLILNGRLSHDRGIGRFTRDDTTGRSVVDYAIGSPSILKSVDYFEVLCKFPESDHRPVSLSLSCNKPNFENKNVLDEEWEPCYKYFWSRDTLDNLVCVISDNESDMFLDSLQQCIINLCDMNTVAVKLGEYISQACKRAFKFGSCKIRNKKYAPPWYDNECRSKRSQAVKAGERVSSLEDKEKHDDLCREYRACKQL